jgi:hypothetical protein
MLRELSAPCFGANALVGLDSDAMVFSQVVSACNAAEYSADDPIEVVARWETPVSHLKKEVATQSTFGKLLAALAMVAAANPAGTDPELSEIKTLIEKALTVY